MDAFSSCLRNMIVAPKGKILDVADYSAIELRVAFWVANHERGLRALREGKDLYRELAAKIYNVKVGEVTSAYRFVGKTAELGCLYGMGKPKFLDTCKNQGQEISEEVASVAVDTFRRENAPVVTLWSNLGKAAIAAVQNPGKKYTINHTAWFVQRNFLWCELPSGRRLAYAYPSVVYVTDKWRSGVKNSELRFWGVDSKTKKWCEQRVWGGVLVENVVQAIARDLMAEAMLRVEKAGWELVLSVHDELIGERFTLSEDLSLALFCELMEQVPAWGEGLPIKVEGYSERRYRK
jgi:DNA polymerase